MKYIDHQPGNATRYEIYLEKVREDHWLVAVPEFNIAFIIYEGATLAWSYVQEKANRGKKRGIGDVDASEIAKVVAREIGVTAYVCTDAHGHYTGTACATGDAG